MNRKKGSEPERGLGSKEVAWSGRVSRFGPRAAFAEREDRHPWQEGSGLRVDNQTRLPLSSENFSGFGHFSSNSRLRSSLRISMSLQSKVGDSREPAGSIVEG